MSDNKPVVLITDPSGAEDLIRRVVRETLLTLGYDKLPSVGPQTVVERLRSVPNAYDLYYEPVMRDGYVGELYWEDDYGARVRLTVGHNDYGDPGTYYFSLYDNGVRIRAPYGVTTGGPIVVYRPSSERQYSW